VCRQKGIEPKYFSLWKSKLRRSPALPVTGSKLPRFVPVTLRTKAATTMPCTDLGLTVTLPNGVRLSVACPDQLVMIELLQELAGLTC